VADVRLPNGNASSHPLRWQPALAFGEGHFSVGPDTHRCSGAPVDAETADPSPHCPARVSRGIEVPQVGPQQLAKG